MTLTVASKTKQNNLSFLKLCCSLILILCSIKQSICLKFSLSLLVLTLVIKKKMLKLKDQKQSIPL